MSEFNQTESFMQLWSTVKTNKTKKNVYKISHWLATVIAMQTKYESILVSFCLSFHPAKISLEKERQGGVGNYRELSDDWQ